MQSFLNALFEAAHKSLSGDEFTQGFNKKQDEMKRQQDWGKLMNALMPQTGYVPDQQTPEQQSQGYLPQVHPQQIPVDFSSPEFMKVAGNIAHPDLLNLAMELRKSGEGTVKEVPAGGSLVNIKNGQATPMFQAPFAPKAPTKPISGLLRNETRTKNGVTKDVGIYGFKLPNGQDFITEEKPTDYTPSGGGMYSKGTPDDIEAAARAVANYDADLATLPRQDKTAILARARAINPKFNQINYNTNRSLKASYTSGKQSGNIISLNTALGHLGDLRTAGKALDNGNLPLLNVIANQVGVQLGDNPATNFEAIRDAVANELATTFKGSSGTDIGLQNMLTTIKNSQSPKQLEGVIKTNVKLLKSRLDALNDNYKKQTGIDYPVLDETKKPFVDEMLNGTSGIPSDEDINKMTPEELQKYLDGK
jgi:hypothetical protein